MRLPSKRHCRSAILFAAWCSVAGLQLPAAEGQAGVVVDEEEETAALITAVWQLDWEFADWAEGFEAARSKGVPYARAERSAQDYLTRLEGLADVLPRDPASRTLLLRKIGIVRDRILDWQGGDPRRAPTGV